MPNSNEKKYFNVTIPRVLLIHNHFMPYRLAIFRLLSEKFPLKIIITKEISSMNRSYDLEIDYLNMKTGIFEILKSIRLLFKRLLQEEYDIVIGGNWDDFVELVDAMLTLTISRIKGKKFILWTESWNFNSKTISFKRKIATPVLRFLVRNSNAVIVPGSKSKELILHLCRKKENIFIAPNWSSPYQNESEYGETTKSPMDNSDQIKFLYLSRIVDYKGLDVLLRAFKIVETNIPDAYLIIGGSGPNEIKMKDMAKTLELKNIEFRGKIPEGKKAKTFLESDIFVLPSKFHNGLCEAWGLVINEAMSCCRPVISTDATGGAYDLIVNGENGYVISAGNHEDLASVMIYMSKNRQLIKKMGKKARDRIEQNFTIHKMLSGFNEAIDTIMR